MWHHLPKHKIILLFRYLPPCYHKRPLQHRSCCWEQLQSRQRSVSRGGCHRVSPGEALGLGHWSSDHNCPPGSGREELTNIIRDSIMTTRTLFLLHTHLPHILLQECVLIFNSHSWTGCPGVCVQPHHQLQQPWLPGRSHCVPTPLLHLCPCLYSGDCANTE